MAEKERSLLIGLVAGELSGDVIGAGLIRAIKARVPHAYFVGIGGPLMQDEGCESWYKIEELMVMGVIEILGRLRRLLYIRTDLIRRFINRKLDIFIGIDAPDFNIPIEKHLKKQGIKTIHYVSPSVWAWRQKRVLKIAKSTHLILVFLPFEKLFYDRFNVPCRFIGHTIADAMPLDPDKKAARKLLGIHHDTRCLILLPGSRKTEIEMLSADFLITAQLLSKKFYNLEILALLVNDKCCEKFKEIKAKVAPNLSIRIFVSCKNREAMIASDAALLASGTASLECMLAKCPMVVGYRMHPFTFWLAKHLVKTNYISLPNLLANQELVKELLQDECKPRALADAIIPLLTNTRINKQMYKTFYNLHKQIRCNADVQAANAVLELINW